MATIDSVINLCLGHRFFTLFYTFFHTFSTLFFTDFSQIRNPVQAQGTDFPHMPSTKSTLKSQKKLLTSAPVITTIPGYKVGWKWGMRYPV